MTVTDDLELDEVSLEELNEVIQCELDESVEMADHCLGLLATCQDLIGEIAVGLHHSISGLTEKPTANQVKRSIKKNFPFMSEKNQRAIKKAVEFHYSVHELNQRYKGFVPAWKDDYPLKDIQKLSFDNVVNRIIRRRNGQ